MALYRLTYWYPDGRHRKTVAPGFRSAENREPSDHANQTEQLVLFEMTDYPVAVIGAGIVGLSTAYALKKRGAEVDLFEPFEPGGAQSVGESRIFRHAHEDPRMVEFSVKSRSIWRDWEDESGQQLISSGGALAIGESAIDRLEVMRGVSGVEVRRLSSDEVARHLPLLAAYGGPAIFDPAGGAIHTRLAIAWLYQQLADLLIPEQVTSLDITSAGNAEVATPNAVRTYSAAITCAGTDTAGLAKGVGIDIPVNVQAQVRSTFKIKHPEEVPVVACLQDSSGEFGESGSYGSPTISSRHYALGLTETTSVPAGSDIDRSPPVNEDLDRLIDRTQEYVEKVLPGLDPRPVGHVSCFVTTLPWGDDGVAAWSQGSLFFLAGHNLFKQAPALGRALAEAAAAGRVPEILQPRSTLGSSN